MLRREESLYLAVVQHATVSYETYEMSSAMHCRHVSHVSPQVLTGGSIVISTVAKHTPSTLCRKGWRLFWCNMEGKCSVVVMTTRQNGCVVPQHRLLWTGVVINGKAILTESGNKSLKSYLLWAHLVLRQNGTI